jgi:uncharacterized protein (TIGR03437 family)
MKVSIFALTLVAVLRGGTSAPPPAAYSIETVAGSSQVGDGGAANAAALSDAQGVTIDSAGNVFIADANDHRVRKIAADGTISTVAGDGFAGFRGDGGPASAARLSTPYGVAADGDGNLFIADLGNNRVRKVSPDGAITTVPGTEKLRAPRNVALDAVGTLYISEFGGHRVRRLRPDGVLESIAGNGMPGFAGDGGAARTAQLAYPAGLAFDSAGNLYVADSSNHRVRKVANGVITTVLGTGDPGADLPNQLNVPTSVAIDHAGNLYVADSGNQRIQLVSSFGAISTLPGSGRDLALDRAGNLLIAGGIHLMELTPLLSLQTIAGDGSYGFRGDGGAAASARLNGPVAVTLSAAGTLYIADQKNLRVRAVDSTATIATILGDGTAGPGANQLDSPAAVAVDASGGVFVADQNNDRIQKITVGGNVQTVAGTGSPGFNGDGLPAALTQLFSPGAMAFAADGALYFSDAGNGRLRNVTAAGTVSSVARITTRGVAVDGTGNVYASDSPSHRIVRIDPNGHTTILAGTGDPGFSGDGGAASSAQLNSPSGVAVDGQGNLYISDTGNHCVRVMGPDGIIRTIAGNGAADFSGDGGPARSASLNAPAGLAVDSDGNVWVADAGNNRVRKLTPGPIAVDQNQPVSVVNAASMLPGPVAPGEMVSIFGVGIGPVTPASGALDESGLLSTELADTKVLFNGTPAPLFYAQDSQVNAQSPYEIAGAPTADVEVFFQGESRGKATVVVAASAPGIFTLSAGAGRAIALNQDGSLNSPIKPAREASIVTLYATGDGLTQPASTAGKPATAPFPVPVLPVTLTVGGYPAQILFAGEAPGYAGLLQVNARLPGGFAPAYNVPVVLSVGAASSQPGVTIAVVE